MRRLDYEAENRRRKLRDKGWEPVDGPDLPPRNSDEGRAPHTGSRPRPRIDQPRLAPVPSPAPKAQVAGRAATDFERAYFAYLEAHARASVSCQPLPEVPPIIERRYQGKLLTSWKKNILKTPRYREALKAARLDWARDRLRSA